MSQQQNDSTAYASQQASQSTQDCPCNLDTCMDADALQFSELLCRCMYWELCRSECLIANSCFGDGSSWQAHAGYKVPARVRTIRVGFIKATAHEVRGCTALPTSRDCGPTAHTDVVFLLLLITTIIIAVLCVRCVVQVYCSLWPAASCSSEKLSSVICFPNTAAAYAICWTS